MLVQYTHLSELSEAEQQRLKAFVIRQAFGDGPIIFEGKALQRTEVLTQKRIWENELRTSNRILLG
jgi:hypothetical protein